MEVKREGLWSVREGGEASPCMCAPSLPLKTGLKTATWRGKRKRIPPTLSWGQGFPSVGMPKKKKKKKIAVAKNGQRPVRWGWPSGTFDMFASIVIPNRCVWCERLTSAVRASERQRQALFEGLYFPNAICRAPSGRGCQASISLINEQLLKFHKSNPITRSTRTQSALMECSNASFSHFRSWVYLINFGNSCFCLSSFDFCEFMQGRTWE